VPLILRRGYDGWRQRGDVGCQRLGR